MGNFISRGWDSLTGETAAESSSEAIVEAAKIGAAATREATEFAKQQWSEFQDYAEKELGIAREDLETATSSQKRMFEDYLGVAEGEWDQYYEDAKGIIGEGKEAAVGRYEDLIAAGSPFAEAGQAAFDKALAISPTVSPEEFREDPYYQFLQEEAQRSVESSAAAKGTRFGGGVLKELSDRAMKVGAGYRSQRTGENIAAMQALTGLGGTAGGIGMGAIQAGTTGAASAELAAMQELVRASGMRTAGRTGAQQFTTAGTAGAEAQRAGLSSGLTGMGISAAGQAAGGAGGAGMMGAQNLANIAMQSGQAQASAYMGAHQGQMGLLSSLAMAGGMAASDRRLKTDIVKVGQLANGLPTYTFKYLGDNKTYKGVMAQEVEKVLPEAVVIMDNGYKAVRYDMVMQDAGVL